jgi:amidase
VRRLRAAPHASGRLFSRYDALVCPTAATPPPRLGHLSTELPFDTALERVEHTFCFTPVQNATGDPAISLPLGRSREGLPIGVQLAAPHGGEARLLALAFEPEAAGAFQPPPA